MIYKCFRYILQHNPPPKDPLLHGKPNSPLRGDLLPISASVLPPGRLGRKDRFMHLNPPVPDNVLLANIRDHPINVPRVTTLGKYLLFTMVLVGLSVVITIIILNVHYRKPSTHKMAPWVRCFFIKRVPKLLLMRVPNDLLQDLAAHKITGRSLKRKDLENMPATQATSSSSSSDSSRQRASGCNGLHSTTATNRWDILSVDDFFLYKVDKVS